MIPCLKIYILSNDIAKLDLLAAQAPARLDTNVWLGIGGEYSLFRNVTREGIPYLTAEIRFNTAAGRQAAWDKIKAKITPTILSKILTGSYVDFHDCNHDEDVKYRITGCGNVTTVWSK